ncbi:MAG: hypothetical protein WBP45_06860 [Daejeonella sp.]
MAYLVDYNKINTISGYQIIAMARIRQYLEFKRKLILNVAPSTIDPEYNKLKGGNVFCYNEYGEKLWQSYSKNIAEIFIDNGQLYFFDSSSIGYICLVDLNTGEIKKLIPTK